MGKDAVRCRKNELAAAIIEDRKANLGNKQITAEVRFRHSFPYTVFRYMILLRKLEYCCACRDSAVSGLSRILYAQKVKILDRKKNILGMQLGIEIPINHVVPGVRIAHGNVILNGYVGKDCIFHGNNVLGNKKTGDRNAVPKLGNQVDVGVGAVIIGNVEIADRCVIGAGAVVTKSFLTPGSIIAGVPAREIGNVSL